MTSICPMDPMLNADIDNTILNITNNKLHNAFDDKSSRILNLSVVSTISSIVVRSISGVLPGKSGIICAITLKPKSLASAARSINSARVESRLVKRCISSFVVCTPISNAVIPNSLACINDAIETIFG